MGTYEILAVSLIQLCVCLIMYNLGKSTNQVKIDALSKLFTAYILTVEIEENKLKDRIKELEAK